MVVIGVRATLVALFLGLAGSAWAQPQPPAPPPAASQPDPDFSVINESGRSIFFIRLRAPGAGAWGEDLLGRATVLRTDNRFLVRPPRDGRCEWDLLVRFDNEVERVFPAVPACRIASIRVTPDLAAASGTTRLIVQGSSTVVPTPAPAPVPAPSPVPPRVDPAPTPRLRVTNGWTVSLLAVQLRPPGRPASDPAWGDDLLGNEHVLPRDSLTLRLPEGTPCRVDIRTIFEKGNNGFRIIARNVDLCAGGDFAANGPPRGELLGTGSGFFVSRAGHIATNQHVVHGCGTVVILRPDGRQVRLRMLQNDPRNDLAVLQLPEVVTPAVTFRDLARPVRQGEALLTMGYPLGSGLGNQVTINIGILTALRGMRGSENRFTFSAPLNSGNSGGPIYDDAGLVVGVAVSGFSGDIQNVNFGVPARLLAEMLATLGVQVESAPPRDPTKPADIFERNVPMVMQLGCVA